MVRKYFKDLTFQIAYFHHQNGINVDNIGGILVHKSSQESAVISARGARCIRNLDWYPKCSTEEDYLDLYNRIAIDRDVGEGLLVKNLQANYPEGYAELMRWANGFSTDRIIVLAYGDAEFPKDFNPDLRPVAHRVGGIELVIDFLLSNFADAEVTNLPTNWSRLDGVDLTDQERCDLRWKSREDVDQNIYRFIGWEFDYSWADDFRHLEKGFEIMIDVDSATYESRERVIYNLDQNAVEAMQSWIRIPYALWKMLSEHQLSVWRREKIPEIIRDHLDFLGIKLFRMNLDSSSGDAAASYIRALSASWDADINGWRQDDNE